MLDFPVLTLLMILGGMEGTHIQKVALIRKVIAFSIVLWSHKYWVYVEAHQIGSTLGLLG